MVMTEMIKTMITMKMNILNMVMVMIMSMMAMIAAMLQFLGIGTQPDMRFVKYFTRLNFKVKNFTHT